MSKHATLLVLALAAAGGLALTGCDTGAKPAILVTLPAYCNTPDGCTLTDDGDIILSIPNFNNKVALEQKTIDAESPALMVKIDKDNKLTKWYEFQAKDLHPDTKKVGPMGCDFGPDGNLYVADNQLFHDPAHKSRLLRINIKDGKPVSCDVVVEGFIVSNAVIWRGDTIYVSETQLAAPAKAEEGKPTPPLISGVYAIKISEWKAGPVKLAPWSPGKADPHLIATYKTSGRIGFGADGLTFDAEGNLYCGIFEDGIIYKTTFDAKGKPAKPVLFAKDPKMACCDGIFWRKADNTIYVADMLVNGVQAVTMDGKVTTVHSNADTTGADGSLDQPCEVIVRGNELIVINMDMPWESDLLTNKKIDKPFTVSVIPIPAK
jgi:sugar lactone lactonase YvrE